MDLNKRKYKIIEALMRVEEPSVMDELEGILNPKEASIENSELLKSLIKRGVDDYKKGRTMTHEEAMKSIKELLNE